MSRQLLTERETPDGMLDRTGENGIAEAGDGVGRGGGGGHGRMVSVLSKEDGLFARAVCHILISLIKLCPVSIVITQEVG